MEPQFRFTLDLIGLLVSTLALVLALIFLPVISGRVLWGVLALVFICAAWGCSLWAGIDSGDTGNLFPALCVISIGLAVICIGLAFVSVLVW